MKNEVSLETKQQSDMGSNFLYTSKIIKAGALLGDTKTLLANWDLSQSVTGNLERFQRQNLFGKNSRSRTEDILAIFRQRYFMENAVANALVILNQKQLSRYVLDRILYFHSTQSDRLLHDAVTIILWSIRERGQLIVTVDDVHSTLAKWVSEGKTVGCWSDSTIQRIAQGLLATLRDFGILHGKVNKKISPIYLPIESFAYIAFYLHQHQHSSLQLLDSPEWRLFFLSREAVEGLFIEAQQHHLLEYQAAGSTIRISFPVKTLEEYAIVISERTY